MKALIGKEAPDFEVNAYADVDFKKIKLSDYRGQFVVLFFYPGDFTFVCPTELIGITRKYNEFKKLNVEVLGISTDSKFTHNKWQESELSKMIDGGVPYPLLSDAGGKVGVDYGVYE